MSDARAFLLLIVALYVIECIGIARRVAVYVERRRHGVRVWGAAGGFGTRAHALDFGDPIGFGGVRFAVPLCPLSISPDGVLGFALHAYNPGPRVPSPGELVPFDGGPEVRAEGGDLVAGGRLLARLGSERAARAWEARIARLRAVPRERRAALVLKILHEHADARAVDERVAAFDRAVRPLAVIFPAIFLFLVAVLPGVVALRGLRASWPGLLVGLLLLQVAAVAGVLHVRRRLARVCTPPDGTKLVAIALSPLSAVRALDVLGRDLLSDFHPLAVVAALGTTQDLDAFAARVLRDLRWPYAAAPALEDPRAAAIAREFADALAASLGALLRSKGRRPDALAEVPAGLAAPGTPLCPRCATVYSGAAEGACADCGGVALAEAP